MAPPTKHSANKWLRPRSPEKCADWSCFPQSPGSLNLLWTQYAPMVQFAPARVATWRRASKPAQGNADAGRDEGEEAGGVEQSKHGTEPETGTEALALAVAGTRDATLAQLLAFLAARIPPARQPPHLKQLGGHHKV